MPIFFLTFSMQDSSGIIASCSNLTMKVEKQSMLRSYEIIRVLTLKYIYSFFFFFLGTRQQLYAWRKQKVQFLFIYLFSTHVE